MSQSMSCVPLHIVFSTKHRVAMIDDIIRTHLHSYLGTVCNDFGCQAIRIGGTDDHVHILCELSRTIPIMKLVERVKSLSSAWMKRQGDQYNSFQWQLGYGAYAVNMEHCERLKVYIDHQKEHHSKSTYIEEQRQLAAEFNRKWDERYAWE